MSHAGVYNLTSMYGATEELWFTEFGWASGEAGDEWGYEIELSPAPPEG